MTDYLARLSRGTRIALGAFAAIVLFGALNVLVGQWLKPVRLDLTAQRLFTLSDGTRQVLASLDEPVHLRLFLSGNLVDSAPSLATYATRVQETLAAYERQAGGKLRVELIDPKPFSDAEDRAVGLGVTPIAAGNDTSVFFGLAATNSTDGKGSIPVFSPDREPFLEYDLTRMIVELGRRGKPVLALFDGVGLAGNPMTRQPEQQLLVQARQFFDVRLLRTDASELPAGTRLVMLVHPQKLSTQLLYAIDQWTLGGGATFIFVDPYAETKQGLRPGMPPDQPASDLAPLFAGWGIGWEPDKAIGDPVNALSSNRPSTGGREVSVPTVQWLGLREDSLARNHPELSELNSILLTTAGQFTQTREGITLDPLLVASASAGTINAAAAGDPGGDPRALIAGIKPTGTRPVLGARVTGELNTAFPDGRPAESTREGEHRARSAGALNLVVVGDADMLMDRNWMRQQRLLGQAVTTAFANNGDFALNLAEQMAGGASLVDLRGRGISWRPFDRINDIERDAQARYLSKEQALTTRLRETESRLAELSRKSGEGGALLSAEGTREIEQFRADLLATRAELRDVQFNLKSDVEQLKTRLIGANVGLVPVIVAAITLLFALRRRNRAVPGRREPTPTGDAR